MDGERWEEGEGAEYNSGVPGFQVDKGLGYLLRQGTAEKQD